jgi:DNA-directed RNA polymerase subunit M/transcription elongation factor TFIIS
MSAKAAIFRSYQEICLVRGMRSRHQNHNVLKVIVRTIENGEIMRCPRCGYETEKKSRTPISIETLEKATWNLRYVVCMLNKMPTLAFMSKPNSPECNAFIESFVIHARILIEFLQSYEKPNDTIIASDYCNNWKDPLKDNDLLLKIKKNINKMGAHLTETGVMTEDKGWLMVKIRDELNKEIEEFLDDENTKITEERKKEIKAIMIPPQIKVPMGALGATGPAEPYKN